LAVSIKNFIVDIIYKEKATKCPSTSFLF